MLAARRIRWVWTGKYTVEEWHTMIKNLPYYGQSALDALIDWKVYEYQRCKDRAKQENAPMQEQVTIELRVDFGSDEKAKEKIPLLIDVVCAMARTLQSNVNLLSPIAKPDCVVFTDNFMFAPKAIDINQNLIDRGNKELDAVMGVATATVTNPLDGTVAGYVEGVSDELLAAVMDSNKK